MKYKLLKDLPGIKAGEIISELQDTHPYSPQHKTVSGVFANAHPDFFEPIVEKKRYEDLKEGDKVFYILGDGTISEDRFFDDESRSEVFLTREEAEDEHKRREWAVRPDRFVPATGEEYFYPMQNGTVDKWTNSGTAGDYMIINAGLAFKRHTHCEKAIKEHDLIRLFYTIR